MNFSVKDLANLRWSLAFLVVALAIVAAVTTTSQKLVNKAQAQQRTLQSQQRDVRARLSRAPEEERELRAKIVLYRQLVANGIIGQEERLDWVEQIARIKAERRLLDLQYEIAPQKPLQDTVLPGGPIAGNYEFMASTMRLQMPLLQENDLLGFIADLRRSVHAHLLVRECSINRASAGGSAITNAQLNATCTIDWITLREKRQ